MHPEEILGLISRWHRLEPEHYGGIYLLSLELLFWVCVALLTLALVRFKPAALLRIENWIRRISGNPRFWVAGFGLAVIAIRVALLPFIPVPVPDVHDECSYLVGANTFAHGRLTNPTPAMWVHFETFHVNMQPTYHSMYPPAQAAALALGERLTGVPWAGVLLTTALMCSAIYWMLLGWLPAPWAWLGGAFVVLRYSIFCYWMNSYFGGSVAALGGALLLGAIVRLRREIRWDTSFILAIALMLLAFSRPLEGLCFSIPVVLAFAALLLRNRAIFNNKIAISLVPAAAVLLAGFGFLLYYNWRTTFNPLLMPYVMNYRMYHISSPFIFGQPHTIPTYHHEVMRAFYVFHELPDVQRLKYEGVGYFWAVRSAVFYIFFLWPLLFLVAPSLHAMFKDKEMRIVLLAVGALAADLYIQMWPPEAHYAAPAAGAIVLLVIYSLRHFRNSHPSWGPWFSRAIVILFLMWMVSPILERLRDPFAVQADIPDVLNSSKWIPFSIQRARIQSELEKLPGKHLIIVHHPYHEVPGRDWIYNDADLDHSRIIWARDMGYLDNRELVNHYPDRQVWYVDRGQEMAKVIPYEKAILPWKLALDSPPYGPENENPGARRSMAAADQRHVTPIPVPQANTQ